MLTDKELEVALALTLKSLEKSTVDIVADPEKVGETFKVIAKAVHEAKYENRGQPRVRV